MTGIVISFRCSLVALIVCLCLIEFKGVEPQKVKAIVERAMREANVKTKEERLKANAEISDAIKDILGKLDELVVQTGKPDGQEEELRKKKNVINDEPISFEEKCGAIPFESCMPRETRGAGTDPGHICEDTDPLEPLTPSCNCPSCTGNPGESDVLDFAPVPDKTPAQSPIYIDKWRKKREQSNGQDQIKQPKCSDQPDEELTTDQIQRHKFSCQVPESVFQDVDSRPKVDQDVAQQMKIMADYEENPSQGILKYHLKRDQEEL